MTEPREALQQYVHHVVTDVMAKLWVNEQIVENWHHERDGHGGCFIIDLRDGNGEAIIRYTVERRRG